MIKGRRFWMSTAFPRDYMGSFFNEGFVRARCEYLRWKFSPPIIRENEAAMQWNQKNPLNTLNALSRKCYLKLKTPAGEVRLPHPSRELRGIKLTRYNDFDFPVNSPFLPPTLFPIAGCTGYTLSDKEDEVIRNGIIFRKNLKTGIEVRNLNTDEVLVTGIPQNMSLASIKRQVTNLGAKIVKVIHGVGGVPAQLVVRCVKDSAPTFKAALEASSPLRGNYSSNGDDLSLRAISFELEDEFITEKELITALSMHVPLLDLEICEKFEVRSRLGLSAAYQLYQKEAASSTHVEGITCEINSPQAWTRKKTFGKPLNERQSTILADHDESPAGPQKVLKRAIPRSLRLSARNVARSAWKVDPYSGGTVSEALFEAQKSRERVAIAVFSSPEEARMALVFMVANKKFRRISADLLGHRSIHYFDKDYLRKVISTFEQYEKNTQETSHTTTTSEEQQWLLERSKTALKAEVQQQIRAFFEAFINEHNTSDKRMPIPLVPEELIQRQDVGRSQRGRGRVSEELNSLQQRYAMYVDRRITERKEFIQRFFRRFGKIEMTTVTDAIKTIGLEVGVSEAVQKSVKVYFMQGMKEMQAPVSLNRLVMHKFSSSQASTVSVAEVAKERASVDAHIRKTLISDFSISSISHRNVPTQKRVQFSASEVLLSRLCHIRLPTGDVFITENDIKNLLIFLFGKQKALSVEVIASIEEEFEQHRLKSLSPHQITTNYAHLLDLIECIEGVDSSAYVVSKFNNETLRLVAESGGSLKILRDDKGDTTIVRKTFPFGFNCEEFFQTYHNFKGLLRNKSRINDKIALKNGDRADKWVNRQLSAVTKHYTQTLPIVEVVNLARLYRRYEFLTFKSSTNMHVQKETAVEDDGTDIPFFSEPMADQDETENDFPVDERLIDDPETEFIDTKMPPGLLRMTDGQLAEELNKQYSLLAQNLKKFEALKQEFNQMRAKGHDGSSSAHHDTIEGDKTEIQDDELDDKEEESK